MKPFAESETNPYAPPETGPVEKNPLHSSFQVFGEGILCRSGLVLPELDMVTGASLADDAVPMRFDLKAPSSLNRTVQKISLVLFLLIPAIMLGLIYLRHRTQPRFSGRMDDWMLACAGLTAVFGLTCALAQWMAPRLLIVGHITRRRSRWMAIRRYFNLAWLVLIFWPLPYPASDIVRLSLFGGVVLYVLVIHPVLTRTIFAGMSLHARSVSDNQVEVTGFSSVFLVKLSQYAEGKNRPVKETTAASATPELQTERCDMLSARSALNFRVRHSRAGGDPDCGNWIPACAGMTDNPRFKF